MSANVKFEASTQDMRNVSQKIQGKADDYKTISTKLNGIVQTLSTGITFPENQVYIKKMEEFQEQLSAMSKKLASLSEIINAQATNIQNRIDINVDAAGRLNN